MECRSCGAVNFDGARECIECGEPIGRGVEGARRESGEEFFDETRITPPPKSRAGLTLGLVAAIGVSAALGLFLVAGGGGSGGGVTPPSSMATSTAPALTEAQLRSELTTPTAQFMSAFEAGSFPVLYAGLSAADRAAVPEADWVQSCEAVASSLGTITAHEVLDVRYEDASQTIAAVDILMTVEGASQKRPGRLYYVWENGHFVSSMLWNREYEALQASQ